MFKKAIIIFCVIGLAAGLVLAQKKECDSKDKAKKEALALLDKAVQFMKENGREKTIAEINKPDGQFVQGSFYVFAYDMEGVIIGHPNRPELLGKNLLEEPDAKDNYFRKEINKIAKEKGEGEVSYFYKDLKTGWEGTKISYFKVVDDVIICSGAYQQ